MAQDVKQIVIVNFSKHGIQIRTEWYQNNQQIYTLQNHHEINASIIGDFYCYLLRIIQIRKEVLIQTQSLQIKNKSLGMSHQPKSVSYRMFKVYIGVMTILALFMFLNRQPQPLSLYQINQQTHDTLHSLIKTKYFRTFRANLNRQCQLYARTKICKSKSCTVCRCDEKDIPTNWIKTDKVKQQVDVSFDDELKEERVREQSSSQMSWIWHVQDEQNDQGEYFDLDVNIESFTNYNGSAIWQMIYQQNCFTGARGNTYNYNGQNVCKQQIVFYKVISGLHTSISSHLSRFYKNTSTQTQLWADLKASDQFFVNHQLYRHRVLDHPDRVENLLFIYQIYLRAIKQIAPYMMENYTVHTENVVDDQRATMLLKNLSKQFQTYQFKPFDDELKTFFYAQNPKVKLYQKYIHNISRLMNCVQCEKCRLFGKMQTYGIGTALKILLGYNDFYKRNEIVALYNAWNKISMSVEFYYKTVGEKEEKAYEYDEFWLRLFGIVAGAFILFIWLIEHINIEEKTKKMFKHVVFPREKSENPVQRAPVSKIKKEQ